MTKPAKAPAGVSIVIQSHRQEQFLDDARRSCREQTIGGPWLDVIEVIDEPPLLPAKRNHGARLSSAGKLVFLSADDMLHPDFLRKTVIAMEEGVDAVYTDVRYFGDCEERMDAPDDFPSWDILTNNRYPGTFLIRRDTFFDVGGYDEDDGWWCDWGLWLKLSNAGANCVRVPEPLFLYRRHDTNISGIRSKEDDDALRAHILRKYG